MNEKEKREYYIVDKRILPNSIQSVIKVNDLVQHSKISKYEAIKKVGISRSTYYKYTLRELEGLSYEEIAEIMDCPVGTVRSRIFRAREAIDKKLQPLIEN